MQSAYFSLFIFFRCPLQFIFMHYENSPMQYTAFFSAVCLFVLRLNVPVNNFFSHVGTEPTLPGFNQYCRE